MLKSRIRSAFYLLLKLLLVAGVFYWLARKDLISIDAFHRGWQHKELLALGLLALLLAGLLTAIRWQFLLRSQSLHLPHLRTLQLHLVGNFFNVALPGAISGDFVKAFYVGRELQGVRSQTLGTIIFDRIVGVSALIFVSVGAVFFNLDTFKDSVALRGIQVFVQLGGVGILCFYGYLIYVNESRDPILKILQSLEKRKPRFSAVVNTYLGIRFYHHRLRAVFLSLLVSIFVHLCAGFSIYIFLLALGDGFLKIGQVYAVAPVGFLITTVPVLPGGVGTGHAAFSFLIGLLGSKQGADAFSFYVVAQLLIGAVGGLIYLRFKSRDHNSAHLSQSSSDDERGIPSGPTTLSNPGPQKSKS